MLYWYNKKSVLCVCWDLGQKTIAILELNILFPVTLKIKTSLRFQQGSHISSDRRMRWEMQKFEI
jgi:hypothetical protein